MAVKDSARLREAEQALARAEAALHEAASDLRSVTEVLYEPPEQITVVELAETSGLSTEAVVEFARAAGQMLGERSLSVEAARRGALLAVAADAWEGELGPLLSSAQVRELFGGVSRQRIGERLAARKLIALHDRAGRLQFPAFQFHDGRALDAVIAAFWVLAGATASEWTAASWCVAPDPGLDGLSPVAWARRGTDPERLEQVARQDAARLAR
jgi:hypothetical protein